VWWNKKQGKKKTQINANERKLKKCAKVKIFVLMGFKELFLVSVVFGFIK